MIKLLGALLLALPLAAIVGVMVREMGWKVTLGIWSMSLTFTASVVGGIALLFGGLS